MRLGKRVFDLVWTLPGVIFLLAPGLIIAATVVIEDGWPPLYVQKRVGLHGRSFGLLKFRSMRTGSDQAGGRLTVGEDHRITRVGRVLRRSKLDELPQLLNVLRGDMSLVGPRPEVLEYVRNYTPEQQSILEIMPGITDPASLKYADESSLLALQEDPQGYYLKTILPDKVRISVEYAGRATIASDFVIILKTVFGRSGGNRRG